MKRKCVGSILKLERVKDNFFNLNEKIIENIPNTIYALKYINRGIEEE